MSDQSVTVSPHPFEPLRRWRNRGRCRRCYLDKELHPSKGWVVARPLGDRAFKPPEIIKEIP